MERYRDGSVPKATDLCASALSHQAGIASLTLRIIAVGSNEAGWRNIARQPYPHSSQHQGVLGTSPTVQDFLATADADHVEDLRPRWRRLRGLSDKPDAQQRGDRNIFPVRKPMGPGHLRIEPL